MEGCWATCELGLPQGKAGELADSLVEGRREVQETGITTEQEQNVGNNEESQPAKPLESIMLVYKLDLRECILSKSSP